MEKNILSNYDALPCIFALSISALCDFGAPWRYSFLSKVRDKLTRCRVHTVNIELWSNYTRDRAQLDVVDNGSDYLESLEQLNRMLVKF